MFMQCNKSFMGEKVKKYYTFIYVLHTDMNML